MYSQAQHQLASVLGCGCKTFHDGGARAVAGQLLGPEAAGHMCRRCRGLDNAFCIAMPACRNKEL